MEITANYVVKLTQKELNTIVVLLGDLCQSKLNELAVDRDIYESQLITMGEREDIYDLLESFVDF